MTDSMTIQGAEGLSRRQFLLRSPGLLALPPVIFGRSLPPPLLAAEAPRGHGPGSRYVPRVRAAFVRRQEDYGILWPGAIYDGAAAERTYRARLAEAAGALGVECDMRPVPLYSLAEAEEWIAGASTAQVDGLLLILLDRQKHAWPAAAKAIESAIPAVIFAPIGAAFTTNTAPLARLPGGVIFSTDDFEQAVFGLKMLAAGARLRETRLIVLKGTERFDGQIAPFGMRTRHLPARVFLEEYEKTPVTPEVRAITAEYMAQATRTVGATEADVQAGMRAYLVARDLLAREEADAITMDCLGALGRTRVSLPCIAWSKLLDQGVPAACEADLGAAVTHALVQYLFDRPGFQQDPVPETSRQCLIGAHCTCPTRLAGFSAPPEPYSLSHHHGNRDAVPIPTWRLGQRVTIADVVLREDQGLPPQMIISAGAVVDNVSVPPSGGCVVSVMVKLDRTTELLDYPGFHQLFFYGDFARELRAYCQLFGIEPLLA